MPFTIVRQDITRMRTDAVVNAANPELRMGGGVCGALFRAAGAAQMQTACRSLAPLREGEAAMTPGFALPAKYVIHVVSPVYRPEAGAENERLLRSAYTEALCLAQEHGCRSIAFPLISGGYAGYPRELALRTARAAIRDVLFRSEREPEVFLVVFDRQSFELSADIQSEVASFIDDHYAGEHLIRRAAFEGNRFGSLRGGRRRETRGAGETLAQSEEREAFLEEADELVLARNLPNLDTLIATLDEPFNLTLLRLIDAKGMTDTEVYKRANLDRKLFSKIRGGKGYMPGKKTILALAVALELNLRETEDLLCRAGYALSRSQIFDVIVEFFIRRGEYDIYLINEVLFKYDQPLLGGA